MLGNKLFEKPLNIKEPWYIEKIHFDKEKEQLDIHINFKKGAEFSYTDEEDNIDGKFKAYDTKQKTWRHVNFFNHDFYIHARVPRVDIGDGKARRIKTPWEGKTKGFTQLFETLLMQLCTSLPISRVEKITDVSDDKLWRILRKHFDKEEVEKLKNDKAEVEELKKQKNEVEEEKEILKTIMDEIEDKDS